MQTQNVRRIALAPVFVAGLIFGPARAFGTALPALPPGDGGLLLMHWNNIGIGTAPLCITWIGATNCVGSTSSIGVISISPLFELLSPAGTIKDIGAAVPLIDFVTVMGGRLVSGALVYFDLVSVPTNGSVTAGNCGSNLPLNTCTPALSPFTYSEDITGNQVTISSAALMNGYTGTSASGSTPYMARFSTNLSGTIIGSGACNGLVVNITNVLSCEAAGGKVGGAWSGVAAPQPPPAAVVPFSSMTASLQFFPLFGFLQLRANFTLGSPAAVFDPVNQPVTLQIGSFSVTIPPGSFQPADSQSWYFIGTINGVQLWVTISSLGNQQYSLSATASPVTGLTSPATVKITVGLNSGSIQVAF
jgi:hypothetical protein